MKLKLIIAYDGANYAGWQTQKTGIGVQQRVEEAVAKIFPDAPRLQSSSRTDTGVHALGMVAHLELPAVKMAPTKVALALNAYLPPDIRVMRVSRARPDFEARFSAKGKQYRYFIWVGAAMNPLLRHTAWHLCRPVNLAAMRQAAKLFIGRHDFKSLAANRGYQPETTVRALTRCNIKRSGQLLTVIIEGDGFLYKMCRGIVGTLAQVGQGKIAPEAIKEILAQRDRRVPPRALFPMALAAMPNEDGRLTVTLRMAVMTGWAPPA